MARGMGMKDRGDASRAGSSGLGRGLASLRAFLFFFFAGE